MTSRRAVTSAMLSLILLASAPQAVAAGDPANGQALFDADCRGCHALRAHDPAFGAADDPAAIRTAITTVLEMRTATLRALGDSQLADIAAYLATLVATAPPNYQGLWWDSAESGWGVNLAHQGDLIYLTWYTYGATGKASWLAMLASKTANGAYSGDIVEVRGSPYDATPYDPAAKVASVVGSGTLTFSSATSGTFAYNANNVSRTVAITKFSLGGPVPACAYGAAPNFAAATNVQDLWWGGAAQDGWGINLAHEGTQIYATWYTYDTDGSPLWLAALLARTSPAVYTGSLLRASGPAFGPTFDPGRVALSTVGTATLTIANGNAATWSYTVGAVSGSRAIARYLFAAPAGTVCE